MSTLDERRSKKRRRHAADDVPPAAPATPVAPAESTAEVAARRAAERPVETINFAAYLRHAVSQAPEQRAILAAHRGLSGDTQWVTSSLQQVDEQSDALARGFLAAGWARGQRVIVLSEPTVDALTSVVALMKIGAVPVVIEPGRSREDVAACAQQALASVVIASTSGLAKRFLARGPFKNTKTTVLAGLDFPLPLPGLKSLASFRVTGADRVPLAATRPAEPGLVLFSTGGAGASRVVVLDHGALIGQAESVRRSLGLNAGEVVLCDDLLLALLLIVTGRTVVMPGLRGVAPRTIDRLLAAVDRNAVTTVIGAPPQWRAAAEACTRAGRMLPNVRQVILTGGTTSLATHAAVQAVLPAGECRAVYAMTEAFPIAMLNARDALGEARGVTERGGGLCLGRVVPGVDIAVLDFGVGGGTPVEPGELGEICVKGARVALTEARAAGPWTRTGDIGWMDRQGRLWLVGSVRRSAHTRFGPIYNFAGEALFELHPRVQRAVLVPLGQPGQQEAVLVVDAGPGGTPKDDVARVDLERELLHAAEAHQVTRGIRRVVFRKNIPFDARLGAQASARELARHIQGTTGA